MRWNERKANESYLVQRGFKIGRGLLGGWEERKPSSGGSGHGQFASFNRTGCWTMAKRYHTDVCCPFERQLWVLQIASKLYNSPYPSSLVFLSSSLLRPCLSCPLFISTLQGWETKPPRWGTFPLHFLSCYSSFPRTPSAASTSSSISILSSATLVTSRPAREEINHDSGLPFAGLRHPSTISKRKR